MTKLTKSQCIARGGTWKNGACKVVKRTRLTSYEPRWWHGFNKKNLQQYYTKITGLSPDTYDWGALDKSLTYSEAKKEIEIDTGHIEKRKRTKRELQELDEQQLYSRHEMRSERAQITDEHKKAKTKFKKDDPNTEKWLRHPEKYDIESIDDEPKD